MKTTGLLLCLIAIASCAGQPLQTPVANPPNPPLPKGGSVDLGPSLQKAQADLAEQKAAYCARFDYAQRTALNQAIKGGAAIAIDVATKNAAVPFMGLLTSTPNAVTCPGDPATVNKNWE